MQKKRILKICLALSLIMVVVISLWLNMPKVLRHLRKEAYFPLKADANYKWQIVGQGFSAELKEVHTSLREINTLFAEGTTIYGATGGGLLIIKEGRVRALTAEEGLPFHNLQALTSYDDALWLGTKGGGLISEKQGSFTHYKGPTPAQNNITSLASYAGDLFLGTRGGLVRFDGQGWRQYGKQSGLPSLDITALAAGQDALWLATSGGLVRYNNHLFETLEPPLGKSNWPLITSLYCTGEELWLGTIDGLYSFSGNLWRDRTPQMGIKGRHISALTGWGQQIFVGTRAGGVVEKRGDNWLPVSTAKDVTALIYFKGDLHIAAEKRLFLQNTGNNGKDLDLPQGLAGNEITSLAFGDEGLWAGTFREGLAYYDGFSWQTFTEETPLEINQIILVNNVPYAATTRGLARFTGKGWQLVGPKQGLQQYRLNGLAYDGQYLWLASANGLIKYDGFKFTRLGIEDGLLSNKVYAVSWDNEALWVGTLAGLSCLKNGEWSSYTRASGELNNNWVVALTSSGRDLWVGTYGGGVSMFDGVAWRSFGKKEGLVSLEINPHALLPWQQGILAGTLEGGLYYISWEGAKKIIGDFPSNNITALAAKGEMIWLGSDSGIWSIDGGDCQ